MSKETDEKLVDAMLDEAVAPIYFSKEEIEHLNLCLKAYRGMVEKFPESYARAHALGVIARIMNEIQNAYNKLPVK